MVILNGHPEFISGSFLTRKRDPASPICIGAGEFRMTQVFK